MLVTFKIRKISHLLRNSIPQKIVKLECLLYMGVKKQINSWPQTRPQNRPIPSMMTVEEFRNEAS